MGRRRSVAPRAQSLAKNLLGAVAFSIFVFGVGILRETQVDGRPVRTAAATASIAGGVVLLVLAGGVYLVWRKEQADTPASRAAPGPEIIEAQGSQEPQS